MLELEPWGNYLKWVSPNHFPSRRKGTCNSSRKSYRLRQNWGIIFLHFKVFVLKSIRSVYPLNSFLNYHMHCLFAYVNTLNKVSQSGRYRPESKRVGYPNQGPRCHSLSASTFPIWVRHQILLFFWISVWQQTPKLCWPLDQQKVTPVVKFSLETKTIHRDIFTSIQFTYNHIHNHVSKCFGFLSWEEMQSVIIITICCSYDLHLDLFWNQRYNTLHLTPENNALAIKASPESKIYLYLP